MDTLVNDDWIRLCTLYLFEPSVAQDTHRPSLSYSILSSYPMAVCSTMQELFDVDGGEEAAAAADPLRSVAIADPMPNKR